MMINLSDGGGGFQIESRRAGSWSRVFETALVSRQEYATSVERPIVSALSNLVEPPAVVALNCGFVRDGPSSRTS